MSLRAIKAALAIALVTILLCGETIAAALFPEPEVHHVQLRR